MAPRLEFEKPVIELQTKIAELKKFTQDSDMDLSAEIERLEDRLAKLQDDIYKNLKPSGPGSNRASGGPSDNS